MRIHTANNRKARRKRAATTSVPFCYLEYSPPAIYMREHHSINEYVIGLWTHQRYRGTLGSMDRKWVTPKQRSFSTYKDIIAHLTKIKLSLCKEDQEYEHFTPCKIIEGYARKGKQTITKVTELPGVSNSVQSTPQRKSFSKRQLQQQRRYCKSLPKTLEYSYHNLWSSGSITGSSTATTVGSGWNETWTVSVSDGGTTFSS